MTINVVLFYPGAMDNDALNQYREARTRVFTDWHPPVMAHVWSWMLPLIDGPQGMLLLQLSLHWLGFWAISDALVRGGSISMAQLALAAGFFPLFPVFNSEVLKDVQMASAWIAAFGLVYRRRALGNVTGIAMLLPVGILLFYGLLLRNNAVFAFGPLVLYFALTRTRGTILVTLLAACIVAVLCIPVSAWVNRTVLGAANSGLIQSLQLFDLAGIAHHSGDASGFAEATGHGMAVVERCHTSYWWDGFSSWGKCGHTLAASVGIKGPERRSLTDLWVRSIASNPGAYVEHRLRHLNSSLLFLVPARHARYAEMRTVIDFPEVSALTTPRLIAIDLVTKNFLLWPVTWLVIGLFTFLLLPKGAPQTDGAWAARLLVLSALMYSLAYAVIGVATGLRYHYWSAMALLVAWIVAWPTLVGGIWSRPILAGTGVVVLSGVVAAGLAFRILDLKVFL